MFRYGAGVWTSTVPFFPFHASLYNTFLRGPQRVAALKRLQSLAYRNLSIIFNTACIEWAVDAALYLYIWNETAIYIQWDNWGTRAPMQILFYTCHSPYSTPEKNPQSTYFIYKNLSIITELPSSSLPSTQSNWSPKKQHVLRRTTDSFSLQTATDILFSPSNWRYAIWTKNIALNGSRPKPPTPTNQSMGRTSPL